MGLKSGVNPSTKAVRRFAPCRIVGSHLPSAGSGHGAGSGELWADVCIFACLTWCCYGGTLCVSGRVASHLLVHSSRLADILTMNRTG